MEKHLSGRVLDLVLSGLGGLFGDSAFFEQAGDAGFFVLS